jgi:hypothetical protein
MQRISLRDDEAPPKGRESPTAPHRHPSDSVRTSDDPAVRIPKSSAMRLGTWDFPAVCAGFPVPCPSHPSLESGLLAAGARGRSRTYAVQSADFSRVCEIFGERPRTAGKLEVAEPEGFKTVKKTAELLGFLIR